MKKRSLRTLTVLLFISQFAFSQNTEVRGFAYNKETGEPILFTSVYLKGTTYGSTTDNNGFYSISRVKPGKYMLFSTYIGFDTFSTEIVLEKGQIISKNIYLSPSVLKLNEIVISDKRLEEKNDVKVSKLKVTINEISKLPAVGAQPDLAQYIQVLPGVITSGDKGGQIYIRGGTPIQNKIVIDGMTIYNPFHSIGLFSVFDVDIIKNMDVYAGGFDAEYGDRISAIMDIKTIDGNKKRLTGKATISPFISSLMIQGPITKFKETSGSSSYIISAKTSYLDKTSKSLYSYADENGLPYSFTDLYGKVSFNSQEGSKISFFGFNFTDNVDYTNITQYNWKSSGIGTQFLLVPTQSNMLVEGYLSYSNYKIEQTELDNKPRFSYVDGFQGGMNFSYYLGKDLLKYGVDITGFTTQFQYYNASNRKIEQVDNTTNIAGYLKYKKIINRLIIIPSLRLQYYASLQETVLEPRLGIKYNLTDYIRLKFAGGYYSQDMISAFSDRDIVNNFYGFLSSPDNIPNTFDGKAVTSRLQKAQHLILGTEFDLTTNSSVNIEGYYKYFSQLTNINRNKIFDNTPEYADKPESQRSDYIIETGNAYGVDVHYILDRKPFYIWIVYDLSYVDRYDGINTYTPNWDRRHNIQILGNYVLGKKNPFEISLRWNYGSSFPFTKTQGYYEYLSFQDGINFDYTKANGEMGIIYSNVNDGRLPAYHRLDISIKKTFNFKSNRKLEIIFSCTNLYNRNNIFYFDRVKFVRINQLPIMPSIGLSYAF
jgi:hypothetical protein